jgi:signal transduction histidine kinase
MAKRFSAPRRTSFDIVDTVRQVIDTLHPITPAGLQIKLHPDYRHMVLGNPNDAFRIVFNLAHNVVALARLSSQITLLDFHLERVKGLTLLRITDNGPGIPAEVRLQLFRTASGRNAGATSGHGLIIARDLAERNGAALKLVEVAAGTQFVLALSSLAAVDSTNRSLGHRTAS